MQSYRERTALHWQPANAKPQGFTCTGPASSEWKRPVFS